MYHTLYELRSTSIKLFTVHWCTVLWQRLKGTVWYVQPSHHQPSPWRSHNARGDLQCLLFSLFIRLITTTRSSPSTVATSFSQTWRENPLCSTAASFFLSHLSLACDTRRCCCAHGGDSINLTIKGIVFTTYRRTTRAYRTKVRSSSGPKRGDTREWICTSGHTDSTYLYVQYVLPCIPVYYWETRVSSHATLFMSLRHGPLGVCVFERNGVKFRFRDLAARRPITCSHDGQMRGVHARVRRQR